MKRSFQIALIIAGLIPFALGIMNFVGGASLFNQDFTASLDNQLRFYAIWFTLPIFLAIWIVRNIEIAGPVLRIMFSVMALSALARLYSISQYGLPEPTMIGAMVIEIVFLLFIPWHSAVLRQSALRQA